jgi:hypothetical protein
LHLHSKSQPVFAKGVATERDFSASGPNSVVRVTEEFHVLYFTCPSMGLRSGVVKGKPTVVT